MNKFEKVKNYYERGLWSVTRAHNAVTKSWITTEEFFYNYRREIFK